MLHWIKFIAAFLQPPGVNVFLFLIGFFFWLRSAKWKAALFFIVSAGSLYALSIPVVADSLIAQLEKQYSSTDLTEVVAQNPEPQAIVALSRGGEAHDSLTMAQHVAKLSQMTRLPILVGGMNSVAQEDNGEEATQVAKSLVTDFNISGAIWIERDSQTTKESVKLAKEILEQSKIKKVFLITKAWYMEQASQEFAKQDVEVTAVPIMTMLHKENGNKLSGFTPSAAYLQRSRLFFYKYLDGAVSKLVTLFSED